MATFEYPTAFHHGNTILRVSEPMAIGRHDWRLVLFRRNYDSHCFVDGEYRRNDDGFHTIRVTGCSPMQLDGAVWRESSDWPRKQPKALAKIIERTPWADLGRFQRDILARGERMEPMKDANGWSVTVLHYGWLHSPETAYHGFWFLEINRLGEDYPHNLRGPFETRAAMAPAIDFAAPYSARMAPTR